MKTILFPVATLVLSSISLFTCQANAAPGSKRPTPPMVAAARLKKYPAPSYLSHYLPDDRYKIAGGVWKYVSTDLDTYYHVPSSPNMLRQPAGRVIGFANARDAEEAGYVADPSDGTASKAAPTTIGGGIRGGQGFSPEENRYIQQVEALLADTEKNGQNLSVKIHSMTGQIGRANDNATTVFASAAPIVKEFLTASQGILGRFNRLQPPPRMQRVHTLLREALMKNVSAAVHMNSIVTTGDISQLQLIGQDVTLANIALKKAGAEFQKIR
ncbi:hypothetical protein IAD21_02086 [Abditibacteriota bacterium]|nr:hypothetical protein IAD21_02086 [Abditibacteriota bacterium]